MYFADQIFDRLPTHIEGYLRSNIEVNSRDEKVPTGPDEMTDIDETPARSGPIHVTEEAIGHHKVLNAALLPQSGIAGVTV